MVDENSASTKLRLQLDALRTERDAALSRQERLEAEGEERQRLLGEEQDRFVSHLLEAHERELGKIRLEVEEARASALRLESKFDRQREVSASLEEQLGKARSELTRTRELLTEAQSTVSSLRGELEMARAMLGDAMQGPGFQDVTPPRTIHEPSRAPRESGIVSRGRASGRTPSTPPTYGRPREPLARRETPRATAVARGTRRSDGPPSSR